MEYVESEKELGEILWQSIENTTEVEEWDTIKFRVSKGLSTRTVTWDIELPQDERSTVQVDVYVGEEVDPQYSERVSCADLYAHAALTGSGTQIVKVYFDGILAQGMTHEMQFS